MTGASMNRTRGITHFLIGLCAILTLALTVPAHADNAFLLQLGTFDSEQQANQKWDDVKAKNGDLLTGLNLHIAEVALPPDNKTTYRTQAGPLTSRDQATGICNSLQKNGVQCYVVETAMFGSGPATEDTQAAATPSEKPVPSGTSATASSAPAAPARTETVSEEDKAHADDPDYIPPPMDSGPVVISSTGAPAPAAASPADIAEMPFAPMPAHAAPAHVMAATETPAPAPVIRKESDDETPAPMVRRSTPVTQQTAANQAALHYVPGREPHYLNASSTMVASAPPEPAPVAPAAPEKPKESRGFFSRLFNFSSSEPTPEPTPAPVPAPTNASGGVVGSVNVAEAVRVPLSGNDQAARQKIVPVIPSQLHPLGGSPTESTDKTLWAQVSYFRNEEQALTFFRQFLAAYPQFADGLRLRITRPFAASAARVSLRVGPFAGPEDVRTVCAAAARWSARCTVVRDIGASAAMNAAPAHTVKRAERSRSTVGATEQMHGGQYWAQLGTYHSSLEAWDAWRELKSTHHKIAAHIRPTVTTPASSSAVGNVYRLRAGPFTSEEKANDLCNRLQEASTDCLVINEH